MAPSGAEVHPSTSAAVPESYLTDDSQDFLETTAEDEVVNKSCPRQPIKPLNVFGITLLHAVGLYALFTAPVEASWLSIFFCTLYGLVGGFGVTAGVHRLWAHKTYKAKLPLRLFLGFCFSVAGQNTIPEWVLDHRVHHKYTESNADPHNSNRGFFFAHVGWLMQKKHPDVLRKGKTIDMTDILADPVVKFHTDFFTELKVLFCFVLPILFPIYVWNESVRVSVLGNILRYCISLNVTWLVNSAAHIYGNRPFNKDIHPAQNMAVSLVTLGEGWHNYHHVFPWDYKAAEIGHILFNTTTVILDAFAAIGQAYDLKSPSKGLVLKMAAKYGDGSYHGHQEVDENGEEVNAKND